MARDHREKGAALSSLLTSLVGFSDLDFLSTTEDSVDGTTKLRDHGGETVSDRGKLVFGGSRVSETLLAGGGDNSSDGLDELHTKVVTKELEHGERDGTVLGADTDETLSSNKSVSGASSSETCNTVAELLVVLTRSFSNCLEQGSGVGADSAKRRHSEGDEMGVVLFTDLTILLLLLGGGGSKDLIQTFASVGRGKFVADTNVDGIGSLLVSVEEDVRTMSAGTFSRLGTNLGVIDVGIVGEVEATTAVIGTEIAWFLDDVGVAGVTESIVEEVTDSIVAFSDGTTSDGSTADDVVDPLRQETELGC